jgi:MinD-like ATPase involved in chromosome partitioning or flagellar assembly
MYRGTIVAGRERRENAFTAILDGLRRMYVSEATRREAFLEDQLARLPGLTRTNTIAVISPKGGVGKTTTTFVLGSLLASRLKARVIAIDANPDFGTLAGLAPDDRRSDDSLAGLLAAMPRIASGAEVLPFVSRLSTGLHLLAAPGDPDAMAQITPAAYGELLAFLGQYYELIVLDLGTGITDPLARFAVERSDQVVLVTTPEWITATTVSGALRHLELTRALLVLNQARSRDVGDLRTIERHFAGHELIRRVKIPYDEQLRTMLDSGTYVPDALRRPTRMPLKELGVEVARHLV